RPVGELPVIAGVEAQDGPGRRDANRLGGGGGGGAASWGRSAARTLRGGRRGAQRRTDEWRETAEDHRRGVSALALRPRAAARFRSPASGRTRSGCAPGDPPAATAARCARGRARITDSAGPRR